MNVFKKQMQEFFFSSFHVLQRRGLNLDITQNIDSTKIFLCMLINYITIIVNMHVEYAYIDTIVNALFALKTVLQHLVKCISYEQIYGGKGMMPFFKKL